MLSHTQVWEPLLQVNPWGWKIKCWPDKWNLSCRKACIHLHKNLLFFATVWLMLNWPDRNRNFGKAIQSFGSKIRIFCHIPSGTIEAIQTFLSRDWIHKMNWKKILLNARNRGQNKNTKKKTFNHLDISGHSSKDPLDQSFAKFVFSLSSKHTSLTLTYTIEKQPCWSAAPWPSSQPWGHDGISMKPYDYGKASCILLF